MRRPERFRSILAGVVLTCLLGFCAAVAEPVRESGLGDGVRVLVEEDGAIVVRLGPAGDDEVLLDVSPLLPSPGPLRRTLGQAVPFTARFREGDPFGHRAFSRFADDDGDGRIDEDRADGVDNDGDGRIDEDFAAVGDEMTVVDVRRGDRVARLETYRWNYPSLKQVLFASWCSETQAGAPRDDELRLSAPEGEWRTLRLDWEPPLLASAEPVAGRPIHVLRLRHGGGELWFGVAVLDPVAPEGGRVARLEGGELVLPLSGDLAAALVVVPTLTQLRCRLATAFAVHRGVRADPAAPAHPWIVPALRVGASPVEPLAAVWRPATGSGWTLEIVVPGGMTPRFDPETLESAAGRPGVPASVTWTPETGVAWTADWPAPEGIPPYHRPPGRAPLEGPGLLSFFWPEATAPPEAERLKIRTACGLGLELEAVRAMEQIASSSPTAEGVLEDRDQPPLLSPGLLDIYPNPTRDHAALRYRVPRSLGEAFVWEDAPPEGLDLTSAVPYTSGQPTVTLTVYTVAGHEISNIFAGSCGVGEYSATWNGTDSAGRSVAAGTYFLKLQIDKWSVTKRVALLR